MKATRNILIYVLSLFVLASCDVHEFPVDRHRLVPFTLHLNFDTEMPFHKEVQYTRSDDGTTKVTPAHDVRYVINAYRTDNVIGEVTIPDTTYVFTKSELAELNYTAQFEIHEGVYDFRVWCDYVDAGSNEDKYYDTSDFNKIILKNKDNHSGNNDYRDAFRGNTTGEVIDPSYYTGAILGTIRNEATVEMSRPMGKFEFISTDVDVFLSRVASALQKRGLLAAAEVGTTAYEQLVKSIDLGQFTVITKYDIYMPCAFDMFTDKAAGSWEKMTYKGKMERINDTEMLLTYDYVFVRDTGTTLSISLEVYDKDGKLLSSSRPIDVPIARSKYTTVKGEFLTSVATGGIAINPGYDGDDYNIEIKFN